MGSSGQIKPPIILLGNVRSGTSMTMFCFGKHPELAYWNEPRTVWTYAAPGRRHDVFDEDDARPGVIRYIRQRWLQYQRANGDRRVMEKTPSNVMRIPYVHRIFPEAKFVYILREPLANLSSSELKWRKPITRVHLLERFRETPKTQLHYYGWRLARDTFCSRVLKRKHVSVWGVRYPGIYDDIRTMSVEQVIAKQWVACCQQADRDLERVDPALVYRLRYEDFVENPVPVFERVLGHFDLQMTQGVADEINKMVDPNRRTKWRRLDPSILAQCLPILEPEMRRQGYEVPEEVQQMLREHHGEEGIAPAVH